MINMANSIYLSDRVVEEVKDTATSQKTHHCWFCDELDPLDITTRNVPPSSEKQEETEIVSIEIKSQEEPLSGHYYTWIEVPRGEIFGVGGGVELTSGAAVGSSAIFNGYLKITQVPATRFHIWPPTWEPGALTQDLEQLTWDRCREVLRAFANYAKEILNLKEIVVTDTRIRKWQAIDDSNWKQYVLDITVKAESQLALNIWDELTEELQKFINTQPELIRPFIEDKLSLDVKWV